MRNVDVAKDEVVVVRGATRRNGQKSLKHFHFKAPRMSLLLALALLIQALAENVVKERAS